MLVGEFNSPEMKSTLSLRSRFWVTLLLTGLIVGIGYVELVDRATASLGEMAQELKRIRHPYNQGLGIAFDGKNLWVSGRPPVPAELGLTLIDASGQPLRRMQLDASAPYSALAYDRRPLDVERLQGLLWAALLSQPDRGPSPCQTLKIQGIDANAGAVVHEIDIAAAILGVTPCEKFGPKGIYLDGMGFDESAGTLYVSPDQADTAYEINPVTGALVRAIPLPDISEPRIKFYSGIAVGAGCIYDNSNDDMVRAGVGNRIVVTDMEGDFVSQFAYSTELRGEDLAFDDVTFEGKLALWVTSDDPKNPNRAFDIVALQVPRCDH